MDYICRLCLTKCEEFIDIFSEYGKEQNIAAIISKYFWFEMLEEPDKIAFSTSCTTSIICHHCWWNIDTFNKFYINIEMVHNQGDHLFQFPFIEVGPTPHAYKNITITECKPNRLLSTIDEFQNNETMLVKESKHKIKRDINETEDLDIKHDGYLLDPDECDPIEENDSKLPNEGINKSIDSIDENKRKCTKVIINKKSVLENEKQEKRNLNEEKFKQEAKEMRQYFDMKCELCDTVFESLPDAHQHYRRTHKTMGYLKCCGRKFFKRCRALEHIAYHLNPDTFSCTVCGKSFFDKSGLNSHMEVHVPVESRQYKCSICTLSFAKKCKLTQHERTGHSDIQKKNFICDICNKCYITKAILAGHIRRAHQEHSIYHVCDICAKTFRSKKVLEDHRSREHFKIIEPRVQCSVCGSWLSHLTALRRHTTRQHISDPQKCSHCGKLKKNKDALRRHIKSVHQSISEAEMYKCSICKKTFKKAIALKEHMASHTGEFLYTCPHCPKTFNSNANMHSHRKKIHPVEWQSARLKRYLQ